MKQLQLLRPLAPLLLVALILTACNEDKALDITNENLLNTQLVRDDANLQAAAVNATYASLQTLGLYARWAYFLEDHMSDELTIQIDQPAIQRISDHLLDATTESNTLYYISCYQGIARCNNVIVSSESWTTDQDMVTDLVAEARFMRANYYFLLASRFGDVPIQLGMDTEFRPKSPRSEVYELIVQDLTFAAQNLPAKGVQGLGRPTNETAYAYLGKVELFRENWEAAYTALNEVVSYSLVDNYEDNFNEAAEYNDESLFEIGFRKDAASLGETWGSESGAGNVEVTFRSADYSGWGNSRPTSKMLAAYEEGDPRFDMSWWREGDSYGPEGQNLIWGTDPDAGGQGFTGPESGVICSRKYSTYLSNASQDQDDGTNPRIIRYADVLLMKAEAALRLNRLGEAVELMNEVRARPSVDMPRYGTDEMDAAGYPVNDQDEVFAALIHERQIELAMEGKRLVDLQRWGLDLQELQPVKAAYTVEKRFLPIPSRQVDTNPLIDN